MMITSQETSAEIYAKLAKIDDKFQRILSDYGEPDIHLRPHGFRTLVYIIVEQQISLNAANKIFARLESSLTRIEPEIMLHTSSEVFRAAGLSRQKIATILDLSNLLINRQLDLEILKELEDEEVRKVLTSVKGIGNWTTDIYLLEVLNRPDILPVSDLALARCIQDIWELETRPDSQQIKQISEKWRPWRSYAVRLIWSAYLHGQQPV
jgi:DNA-3-methyladenine glycosylase II